MSNIINVSILDDDNLFVEGLSALISSNPNFNVIFKTNNPLDYVDYLITTESLPDIAIIDLNMKPINGLEVLDLLHKNNVDVKIIVLSSLFNVSMYGYMIKYSISAFLPKYIDKVELYNAIEQVFAKQIYVNEQNLKMLDDFHQNKKKAPNPWSQIALTDREIEVLVFICKEFSTKEIADNLCISIKTVESHRAKLMEKIGCKNVIGMVVYAVLNGYYILSNNSFKI